MGGRPQGARLPGSSLFRDFGAYDALVGSQHAPGRPATLVDSRPDLGLHTTRRPGVATANGGRRVVGTVAPRMGVERTWRGVEERTRRRRGGRAPEPQLALLHLGPPPAPERGVSSLGPALNRP